MRYQVRFAGPGHPAGPPGTTTEFVELEDELGHGVEGGEWIQDGDDWLLRTPDNSALGSMSMHGLNAIALERARQVIVEGWTPEHDDDHTDGSLAVAAACYALEEGERAQVVVDAVDPMDAWPWHSDWDKRHKHPRLKQLAIAGALIAAEIDRLMRAAMSNAEGGR